MRAAHNSIPSIGPRAYFGHELCVTEIPTEITSAAGLTGPGFPSKIGGNEVPAKSGRPGFEEGFR